MKIDTTPREIRTLLELAELDARAEGLPPETYKARREAQRRQVAEALLIAYESLLDAARYPAIVPIVRGACSGCHVRLPTMIESEAGRSPSVHSCSHCRRLVYAPKHLLLGQARDSGARAPAKKAGSTGRARASVLEPT